MEKKNRVSRERGNTALFCWPYCTMHYFYTLQLNSTKGKLQNTFPVVTVRPYKARLSSWGTDSSTPNVIDSYANEVVSLTYYKCTFLFFYEYYVKHFN